MSNVLDTVLPESPLWERVHQAIQSSPFVSENQVHFAAKRGEVTIHGKVDSFFQKQMAQEVIGRIDGVQRVENQLQVDWTNNETVI